MFNRQRQLTEVTEIIDVTCLAMRCHVTPHWGLLRGAMLHPTVVYSESAENV